VIFEWDAEKAIANERKHHVDFKTAVRVFLDPNRLEDYDFEHGENEDRWITIGLVEARMLMVVYTERRETIRLISARKATKDEQKAYRKIQSRH
jgi:uncharacterized DUF497 family protein